MDPQQASKAVVKAHDRAFSNTLSEQLEYEKDTQRMLFDFPHVSEGIRAFIEKQTQFSGRKLASTVP